MSFVRVLTLLTRCFNTFQPSCRGHKAQSSFEPHNLARLDDSIESRLERQVWHSQPDTNWRNSTPGTCGIWESGHNHPHLLKMPKIGKKKARCRGEDFKRCSKGDFSCRFLPRSFLSLVKHCCSELWLTSPELWAAFSSHIPPPKAKKKPVQTGLVNS